MKHDEYGTHTSGRVWASNKRRETEVAEEILEA